MNTFKTYHYSSGKSYWERLVGSILFLGILVLLFYLFYQLYKLLWLAVPVLLLAILIMDSKVLGSHLKSIGDQIGRNFVGGMALALINLIGFPFVLIGLILKSWIFKKFSKINQEPLQQNSDSDFSPYEEIDSMSQPLPPNRLRKKEADHRYDDLFE